MKGWQAALTDIYAVGATTSNGAASNGVHLGWTYGVVEFDSEAKRTIRTIAQDLSHDEAYAVANAKEVLSALAMLWDAIHREDHEDYFDSELVAAELKTAFDVLMKAKGVKA